MDKKKFVSKLLIFIFILFNSIAYSEDIKKAWLGISVKPNTNGSINLIISEIEIIIISFITFILLKNKLKASQIIKNTDTESA